MTEIPEHLLRRAQRAKNIVHNDNWAQLLVPRCDSCDGPADLISTRGPSELICNVCHSNLAEEHQ